MSERLNIRNEMSQLDGKNRDFYDSLDDEERKKFSNYLMIRWSSGVRGSSELQSYYVQSCNHYLNKHFFAVNRHPKLQWLMATAVSPGLGNQDHQWIKTKTKEKGSGDIKKILMKMYPNMKADDVETLSNIITKKELDLYLKDHGNN